MPKTKRNPREKGYNEQVFLYIPHGLQKMQKKQKERVFKSRKNCVFMKKILAKFVKMCIIEHIL